MAARKKKAGASRKKASKKASKKGAKNSAKRSGATKRSGRATAPKRVEAIVHEEASRTNIPTAEYQSVMDKTDQSPIRVAYARRNRDLDPQLVWRGKDEQDASDLIVQAPPLFIQEKVHPKALVDDLRRESERNEAASADAFQADLFADFNGVPDDAAKTEFYQHDANWTNRLILGDSLQVMASLAEREGLRGKVQCIYLDPPYGIKFNSNFQWSTTSRDVKDGKAEHITREPEQVKAFRDTWRDGIHSYLAYLRDRLEVCRDLLSESGSIFVQIGDENVHRVRSLMDEVLGEENFLSLITLQKTGGLVSQGLVRTIDFVCWYAKDKSQAKVRQLYRGRSRGDTSLERYDRVRVPSGESRAVSREERELGIDSATGRRFRHVALESANPVFPFRFQGQSYSQRWKTNESGLRRLSRSDRIATTGRRLNSIRYVDDFPVIPLTDRWESMQIGTSLVYVVQTAPAAVQNCLLLASDPGDLVLDPTCGSGTTSYVAEQWGRRWITIDTSRVALALARARIMGARFPYYLLADSREGQIREAELSRTLPSGQPVGGNISHGFVCERVPHITLKSIANNAEIDVIWDKFQERLEPIRQSLNAALGESWEEWEIPREAAEDWSGEAKKLHEAWWQARIARQQEIDASIAAKADYEYLYDKPYEDKKTVRVSGPFTVESLSPHRTLAVDHDDELIDLVRDSPDIAAEGGDFATMVLEHLATAGVQQAHKEDKIEFTSIEPWAGQLIAAEARYSTGDDSSETEKRAAIFIGPEFGTVSRPDLVAAAREAGDADFDVLVACGFSYDARSADFDSLGRIPVLKATMNADLHMADDLKNTGKGNLFVIFGEPDIDILDDDEDASRIRVRINGVDVFHPNSGEVRSDGPEGIACWFLDTDYDEESFFVRQAYFLGANDPYKSLKTTLRAEIDEEAWATLQSDTSRAFMRPASGRIAVKVINHLGDEVMKVFRV